MPFHTLLFDSLLPGTSAKENGKSVFIKPKSGETVLFFRLDQPFHQATGLRRFLEVDQPVTDLIVFFRADSETTVRLGLVELKGGDISHGVEQLLKSRDCLEALLKKAAIGRGSRPQVEWRALIRTRGGSPPSLPRKKEIERAFGKHFKVQSGEDDIGAWLRAPR